MFICWSRVGIGGGWLRLSHLRISMSTHAQCPGVLVKVCRLASTIMKVPVFIPGLRTPLRVTATVLGLVVASTLRAFRVDLPAN